MGKYQPPKTLG
jgi:hypothetical protein